MPGWLMVVQGFVMINGLFIFTDFYYSKDPDNERAESGLRYRDPRLVFSFDSSAWLFLYHFGVAMWVEDHVDAAPEAIGYSGSSGGALVGSALAAGVDAQALATYVIREAFPVAGRNPFRLLPECEKALDGYLPKNAHVRCTDVLRVLLTKVSWHPPFLMGEVVSRFRDWPDLFACLRASCHVPFVGGFLPYPAAGRGWYYDGLVWSSLFVPWRTFGGLDSVIKVSPFGAPGADIYPRKTLIPPWWAIFPPSMEVCFGLMALGYRDANDYYRPDRRLARSAAAGEPLAGAAEAADEGAEENGSTLTKSGARGLGAAATPGRGRRGSGRGRSISPAARTGSKASSAGDGASGRRGARKQSQESEDGGREENPLGGGSGGGGQGGWGIEKPLDGSPEQAAGARSKIKPNLARLRQLARPVPRPARFDAAGGVQAVELAAARAWRGFGVVLTAAVLALAGFILYFDGPDSSGSVRTVYVLQAAAAIAAAALVLT